MLRRRTAVATVLLLVFALGAETALAQAGGQIFADGFESGDLSSWAFREKVPGTLDVNPGAALGDSNFGLEVGTEGRAWIQTNSPRRETTFVAGFRIDPNSLQIDRGARVEIFRLYGKGPRHHVKLALQQVGPNQFAVHLLVRANRGPYQRVGTGIINRGEETQIEVAWSAATAFGGATGTVGLWVNETPVAVASDVDNDSLDVRRVRMGLTVGRQTKNAVGTYYLDDFSSFRTLAP